MKKSIFIPVLAFLFNSSLSYAEIIPSVSSKYYYFPPDGNQYTLRYGDNATVRSVKDFTCKASTNSTKTVYLKVDHGDQDFTPVKYGSPVIMGTYYWIKPWGVPEYYFRVGHDGCSVSDPTCNLTAGIDTGTDVIIQCNPK